MADGTIDFGDVDLTDAHVTAVMPGAAGYLGTFVADVTNHSTGDGVGQVTGCSRPTTRCGSPPGTMRRWCRPTRS